MKLGLVGDLSGRDPARLAKALDAALAACDCVVQLGDIDPAYSVVADRIKSSGGRLYPVPGNHDTGYDQIGAPRNWRLVIGDLVTLIGIDNSTSRITDDGWKQLGDRGPTTFGFVFAHMAPAPIVKPDGSISTHAMIESGPNPDADKLISILAARANAMAVGHFHDWTVMDGPWGSPLILEGRGGAADVIGYTAVTILKEGWSFTKVDLA